LFKCILCYNNQRDKYEPETQLDGESDEDYATRIARWAETDQLIASTELRFTNGVDSMNSSDDYIQALRLVPDKNANNGVFNLYEATFSADSSLINQADEYKPRQIKATFWSAANQEEEMDTVERLAWYIPKNYTMIQKPADGHGFGEYTQIDITEDTYVPDVYYTRDNTVYSLATGDFVEGTQYYEKGQERFFETASDIPDDDSITDEERNHFLE
jgi:hypothetical protein